MRSKLRRSALGVRQSAKTESLMPKAASLSQLSQNKAQDFMSIIVIAIIVIAIALVMFFIVRKMFHLS